MEGSWYDTLLVEERQHFDDHRSSSGSPDPASLSNMAACQI